MALISQEDRTEWIKLKDCKDGYLYLIHARNSHIGIFKKKTSGFIISRIKGNNFLFEEYHWECEEFATVKPIRLLEKVPKLSDEKLLQWLNEKGKQYPFSPYEQMEPCF